MTDKNKKEKEKKETKAGCKIAKLEEELKQQKELAESYLDQLKRLQAQFENYRKRVMKESEVNFKNGEKTLATGLLYVLDNIQRALDSQHIDREGITLIQKEFYNILRARGLKKMDAEGYPFDPNFHHALSFIHSPGCEDGKIVEVIQPGYFWDGEVLRPAQVVVAKEKEEANEDNKEER